MSFVFNDSLALFSRFLCILAPLLASRPGSLPWPSSFRGTTLPPGRRLCGRAPFLGSMRAFRTQNWVRFGLPWVRFCAYQNLRPLFSVSWWPRSSVFCFSEVPPPWTCEKIRTAHANLPRRKETRRRSPLVALRRTRTLRLGVRPF